MKNIFNIITFISLTFLTTANASQPALKSDIFSYDDETLAKNLHAKLVGDNWFARDATSSDLPFYLKLFGNETVMAKFGSGKPMEHESVVSLLNKYGPNSYEKGNPDGLLLISDDKEQPFMHIMARHSDRPGVSQLQYAMMDTHWGKKYGEKIVKQVVQEWAPEVARIGFGRDLDKQNQKVIVTAFNCFAGKHLEQIDACVNPANPGSVKILEKVGFQAAQYDLNSTEVIIDFDLREFDSLQQMDNELVKLFDPAEGLNLAPKIRYRMLDPAGKIRTVSLIPEWGTRYHVELKVGLK